MDSEIPRMAHPHTPGQIRLQPCEEGGQWHLHLGIGVLGTDGDLHGVEGMMTIAETLELMQALSDQVARRHQEVFAAEGMTIDQAAHRAALLAGLNYTATVWAARQ